MGFDKPFIQTTNPNRQLHTGIVRKRTIFYGEVVSIEDETDGGRIKVRIPELDNLVDDANLPWSYPQLPKFFHVYPQVGEVVRISLEDRKFPERSRFWMGSIISQPQRIGFDTKYTALSTTNLALTPPDKAPSTYPDADGVYPTKADVAIVGKVNTDVILRVNELHLRAGKHENDDVLKLNTTNPAHISMVYEPKPNSSTPGRPSLGITTSVSNEQFYSNTIIMSDKLALITHSGDPKFKSARLTPEDRERIFDKGHPMARADVIVEALEVIRLALLNHIHGYSGIEADKTAIITKLEELQFEQIMKKDIVIN
jgi:hypothetical protein